MIPLTRPLLGASEQTELAAVLATGMLVQGVRVADFEAKVATHTGRRHAIAVSNGTSALELALRALDIAAGDRVLCPDLTWPSPAHAILACGAEPVLVEVDAAEWNAGPAQFRAALSHTQPARAAIVIDQFGNPARVPEIAEALPGVPLIVDAACSLGSRLNGVPCGALGVIACTSFHPRKVITTGEGGMCLTDDDALAERLRELRNHGQSAPGRFARASGNHRLTELAAAVGSVQMTRLPGIVDARRTLADRYHKALARLPITTQQSAPGADANHQTFGVLLAANKGTAERDRVVQALIARGVQAGALSYALHALPQLAACAQAAAAQGRSFATSASIVARGFAIPLFPGLLESEQDQVIAALHAVLG
jgi:perosamine synthetase